MTEPPEPRDPEDGGGADDDELREFLESEYFAEMSDDMLLDEIGRGEDHRTVSDEMPDEEWEMQDAAHDWRDEIEEVPLPDKLDPAAILAEHERRKKADGPPGPRQTSEGTTPSMSLSEVIARLQMVAGNSAAEGPLAQAKAKLEDEVLPLLMQAVEQLVEIKNTGVAALEGNMNTHAELSGAAEHAAGAIEDAIALTQSAIAGTGQAACSAAAFRQTALDIAGRLSGG